MVRGLQPVSTVIAWAAGNPDRAGMRCNGLRQLRHSQARTLHQGVRRQLGGHGLLQAACGFGVEQGVGLVGRDALHGKVLQSRSSRELLYPTLCLLAAPMGWVQRRFRSAGLPAPAR